MKKILAMSCFFLIGSATVSHAYYYENSMPHNRTNDIDCVDCHGEPDWTGQVAQLPKLLKDCTSCHTNESGSGFTKASAPHAQTHHGECWDCHRNHDVRRWFPDPSVVTGIYSASSYDVPSNTTSFTLSSHTVVDDYWLDPATWNAKTTEDRGLNLWVTYTDGGDDSFEVITADASSITVKGDLTAATADSTFELHYGQMIPDTLNSNDVIFTGPLTFAHNDQLAGDWDGDGQLDDSTPDGVCQVCHTVTNHWRQDGSHDAHFGGEKCTNCHTHSSGFLPVAGESCSVCHGAPPTASTIGGPDGLVSSPQPTGSTSPGAHAKHSDQYGYTFSCDICHIDGMPVTPLSGNYQIQIGFQIWDFDGTGTKYDGQVLDDPYTYEATNGTQVTTFGSQKCSNIYCHSDGTSISTSLYTPTIYTGPPDTTPAWTSNWNIFNDPDGNTCNNCHLYPPTYDTAAPKANSHFIHEYKSFGDCSLCHYGTTQDNVTIADATKHSNGIYDVNPSPTFYANGANPAVPLDFTYTYDAGGGTCSSNSCHEFYGAPPVVNWGRTYIEANVTPVNGAVCGEVTLNVNVSGFYTPSFPTPNPSLTPPYQCYYEWGDGTIQDWSEDCSATHLYANSTRRTVKWSVRDANRHTTWDFTSFDGINSMYVTPSWTGCTDPNTVDTDGDGMTDAWEILHGLDPSDPADAAFDLDGDGLTNLYEFTLGTDPGLTDTDGDGVDDAHDGDPVNSAVTTCVNKVNLEGSLNFYSTIAELLIGESLTDTDTILMSASGLTENVLFDQPVSINISGGYDCNFSNRLVDTEITGTLTITDGTLIVDKITIK